MNRDRCFKLSVAIFFGPLFMSFTCFASVPYGRDFYVLHSSNLRTNPIDQYVTLLKEKKNPMEPKNQLAQVASSALSELGPYSPSLIESNLEKGRQHFNQGEPAVALQKFLSALHLLRISEGLNFKDQEPILRNIQASYFLLQDFQGLERTYEYLFHLNGGDNPPIDSSQLKFLLEYMEWRRESIRRGIVSRTDSLIDLFELNKRILKSIASIDILKKQYEVRLSLSQLSNLHLIANFYRNSAKSYHSPFRQNPSNIEREYETVPERKLRLLIPNLESEGRKVIERISDETDISESEAYHLKVALGDWYQWNSNYVRAKKYYREAYEILKLSGTDIFKNEFSGPVELPDNGVFRNWSLSKKTNSNLIFSARFNVSRNGRARKIQILNPDMHDKREVSKFTRMLRNTRFRPEIVDGSTAESIGVIRRYLYLKK